MPPSRRVITRRQTVARLRRIIDDMQELQVDLLAASQASGLATWVGNGGDAVATAQTLGTAQSQLDTLAERLMSNVS